jgi:hypothetical protein
MIQFSTMAELECDIIISPKEARRENERAYGFIDYTDGNSINSSVYGQLLLESIDRRVFFDGFELVSAQLQRLNASPAILRIYMQSIAE